MSDIGHIEDQNLIRRKDLVLIRNALKNGWNIPASALQGVPEVLLAQIDDPELSPRTRQSAIKTLKELADHNLNQLKLLEKLTATQEINLNVAPPEPLRVIYKPQVPRDPPIDIEGQEGTETPQDDTKEESKEV